MNIVTKADGSLLKVGTSLATSTTCCCSTCATPQTCGCLPSSLSIHIPAWSFSFDAANGTGTTRGSPNISTYTLSCTARTVVAYKCCYNYQGYPWTYSSRPYITYRINPISVGTVNVGGIYETHTTNAYFCYAIAYGWTGSTPDYCNFVYTSQIEASNWCGTAFCLPNPRNDLASNPCGGITNDLLCTANDFHTGQLWVSFFKPPIFDCSLYYNSGVGISYLGEYHISTGAPCTAPTNTPVMIDGVSTNITVS